MHFAVRTVSYTLKALGYGLIGGFIVGLVVYINHLQSRPDLRIWHTADLDEEFTADRDDEVSDLDAYRRLEERLFEQLRSEVNESIRAADRTNINRYNTGSATDPGRFGGNWNRTFEQTVDRPRAGMLLLHGLSDSPYSMRGLAELAQRNGVLALGLRIPGHGTAPAGLTRVTWRDFAAAVRIAARYVRERIGPDRPFYIVGYSNGAALAVEYSLARLEGEELPRVDALILLSPAIGVHSIAALAVWQARVGTLLGLDKLAWNSILPEYDPYKYNSFAVNAGDQIYRLTSVIAGRMARLNNGAGVTGFPRVLAFQSVVDSTIPPATLIDLLFNQLAPEGHELVLFDINRRSEVEALMVANPETLTRSLLGGALLPFSLTLVTNASDESNELVARHKEQKSAVVTEEPLALTWPSGVYSLSHVALPFSPEDPVYGQGHHPDDDRIQLGSVEVRGEQRLLAVPVAQFMRLRYNPFWPYLERRVSEFLETPP